MRFVAQSLWEYARGVAAGCCSACRCSTQWRCGGRALSCTRRLAAYVAGTFVLLLGYNTYAGLRHDACFAEVVIDSVEELGLGLSSPPWSSGCSRR